MQLSIRKLRFMVGLPLVAVAMALFLLSPGGATTKTVHAATPVDFSIDTPGCSSNGPVTKCSEAVGTPFTVTLNLNSQDGPWAGYDADIKWPAGLSYVNTCSNGTGSGGCARRSQHKYGTLDQSLWPSCGLDTGEKGFTPGTYSPDAGGNVAGPGDAAFSCADTDGSDQSYTGPLASLQFVCNAPTTSPATLTLHNGPGATDIASSRGLSFESSDEALQINCANSPTPTPPPSVGGVSLDPGAGALALQPSSRSDAWLLADVAAGSAAVAVALGGGLWYARRRRAH